MLERSDPQVLSAVEADLLRQLAHADGSLLITEHISKDLEARGYIRRDAEGWSLTVSGHIEYIKFVAARFE